MSNFKVRFIAGATMLLIAAVSLLVADGAPFRVLYIFFTLVAAIELFSFFKKKHTPGNIVMALFELIFLCLSVVFMIRSDLTAIWCIILGVPGYDIFAYFFGKAIGGKIIKHSRPFPHISKNKTWEGTFFGIVTSCLLVAIFLNLKGEFMTHWYYLFAGLFAVCGDLYESYLKRRQDIKDSNEVVIKNPVFAKLELIVGGSNGHGGFLDRIDSIAFATTVFLIINLCVG